MNAWYTDETTTVHAGNSLDVLAALESNSVDSIVCDPPYGLADLPAKKVAAALTQWLTGDRAFIPGGRGFMAHAWDRFVPPPALWDEALRVLKPGGYLLAFASTRTQDLMGMSIRLAGFRMRDQLQWVRADVFPKTKHTLKPGYEPILKAQKPLEGTVQQNIDSWGVGGMNIDAVRTPFRNAADEAETKSKNQHADWGTPQAQYSIYGDFSALGTRPNYDAEGRWPTNIVFDKAAAAALDAANEPTVSRSGTRGRGAPAGDGWGMSQGGVEYDDRGGPSRFYPVFVEDPQPFKYVPRAQPRERPVVDGVRHPTVKPLALMDWAIRLVTPPDGVVLDPFLGFGTTVEAARLAGFRSIGVEAHEPFLPLIAARLERSTQSVLAA